MNATDFDVVVIGAGPPARSWPGALPIRASLLAVIESGLVGVSRRPARPGDGS